MHRNKNVYKLIKCLNTPDITYVLCAHIVTSVLCTSDSVPSLFIRKISRKGSDLLKKSFGGRKTSIRHRLRTVSDHHKSFILQHKLFLQPIFLPSCFFSLNPFSLRSPIYPPLPAFIRDFPPKAQLVWISHPWPGTHVCACMPRLKINNSYLFVWRFGRDRSAGYLGAGDCPPISAGLFGKPDCASVYCA